MVKLGSDTITILSAPMIQDTRTGAYIRDWDNPTSTPVIDVMVEPFPMAEKLNFEDSVNSREFVRTAYRFYCPPGTDIDPEDRILWGGLELSVFGYPGPWKRFSGALHHVVFIGRVEKG